MSEFDPRHAAATLLGLRRQHRRSNTLDPALTPRTDTEGVATQVALAEAMDAMPPAGFKIGATTMKMQQYLGLPGPAAGFIAPAGLHPSGVRLRFDDFQAPGVECEVAVRLARDLPPGRCSPEQAAEAVGTLMAGIEIVENRYGDFASLKTPMLIADQVFHAAAIVADGIKSFSVSDLPQLAGRMTVDGSVRGEGLAGELLGNPMNCLAWLAGSDVIAAFGGLRAGQVIMLGSVTPPIWLDRPAEVVVSFPALPEVRAVLA